MELNYRPSLVGLGGFFDDAEIDPPAAASDDRGDLGFRRRGSLTPAGCTSIPRSAPRSATAGMPRGQQTPSVTPRRSVLKCLMDGRIVAFMVSSNRRPASRFWSLVGLAPGLTGQGLGRRVWQAVLAFHHREGVEEISTSISSHNVAVHNFYVSLGSVSRAHHHVTLVSVRASEGVGHMIRQQITCYRSEAGPGHAFLLLNDRMMGRQR